MLDFQDPWITWIVEHLEGREELGRLDESQHQDATQLEREGQAASTEYIACLLELEKVC